MFQLEERRINRITFFILVTLLLSWICFAFMLLYGSKTNLLVAYFSYLIISTIFILASKKDIFSPLGLFAILGFQAFGVNIPLLSSKSITILGIINDATLYKITVVVIVAQLGFFFGAIIPWNRILPFATIISSRKNTKNISFPIFIIFFAFIALAGIIRIKFHLGEAGTQPTIPFAGIIQYFLYYGAIIVALWTLAQGSRQGKTQTLWSLVLILIIAATQVMLGWRGGIIHVLIMVFFIFWYNTLIYSEKKIKVLGWLLILLILVPSFMNQASKIRSDRVGGESSYGHSAEAFGSKFITRTQGTTRLAGVVDLVGELTLTNNFMLFELRKKGLSSTQYIDRKLYGVVKGQSHSVGTSGPGGPYLCFGLLGVFFSYFFLGSFFSGLYNTMKQFGKTNSLTLVWYAITSHTLFGALSENFNMNTLKLMFIVAIMVFSFGKFVTTYRNHSS